MADKFEDFMRLTDSPLVTSARFENGNVVATFKRTKRGGQTVSLSFAKTKPRRPQTTKKG